MNYLKLSKIKIKTFEILHEKFRKISKNSEKFRKKFRKIPKKHIRKIFEIQTNLTKYFEIFLKIFVGLHRLPELNRCVIFRNIMLYKIY